MILPVMGTHRPTCAEWGPASRVRPGITSTTRLAAQSRMASTRARGASICPLARLAGRLSRQTQPTVSLVGMRRLLVLSVAVLAGCASAMSHAGRSMACVTGGPAVEPALTNAARFIMDTGVAAKELRSRLGLTGLHPRPRNVDDPDLCRRAAMAMSRSERSTDLPGILLVQMGPAYIARRD